MDAVLIDLYATLAWTEWTRLRVRLEEAVDVSQRDLMEGFVLTRDARGVGTFGSVEGDIAAVLKAAGAEVDAETVSALAAEEVAFLREGVHLYEDSLPVLRELHARGIRTAVVSNCDHATREVVNALALETEVDAIVLSFEVGALKPDPRIYRAALEAIGAAPDRVAFVDDQVPYVEGAEALGMRAFLIQREGWEPEDGLPTDRVGLPDLWEVLRALP